MERYFYDGFIGNTGLTKVIVAIHLHYYHCSLPFRYSDIKKLILSHSSGCINVHIISIFDFMKHISILKGKQTGHGCSLLLHIVSSEVYCNALSS